MKTILKTQIKLMQSKYGFFLYFIPLYQLGKGFFYFGGLFALGVMAWLYIDHGYLTQSVYEQIAIIISFLCIYFFKKEKQYTLIPYITKLTVSEIRNYILLRELFSGFNFILIPIIVSVMFLSQTIENPSINYLLICLYLMGVFLNLLTRIIKYFCNIYRFLFITILGILLVYSIVIILFYRNIVVFSFSNFQSNSLYIIVLLIAIVLLIPGYYYVIKQELYQEYDGEPLNRKTISNLNPGLFSANIFNKILLLKYLRCNLLRRFSAPMFSYAIGGTVFFLIFNLKPVGLVMFLSIYTSIIIPFTLYLSSNYFDGLYTKPISIKSLLLSSFYIHIIITTAIFLIMLIFIAIYDNSNILPLVALYLYTLGPMALLLLHNILFAQRFDLLSSQSDSKIERTFAQKVLGFISGILLFVTAAIVYFFSTIGCYIIISLSLIIIMSYSYWINFLYIKFMQRKYIIMENLRKT